MPVVLWISKENLPRTFSIVNLVVCLFDVLLFILTFSWFLLTFVVIRLGIAILLFFGVRERHLDKCKIWCIGEIVLLVILILTMIFLTFGWGTIIWTLFVIALRIYGLWIIYTFIKELQVENGEDNTIASNFCPTALRGIFQRNPGPPGAETTQHV